MESNFNLHAILKHIDSSIYRLTSITRDNSDFLNYILNDLISLIPEAEKGTVFKYVNNKKICVAQNGYGDEFVDGLFFPSNSHYYRKNPLSKIVEELTINTKQEFSILDKTVQELLKKYDISTLVTLRGYVIRNGFSKYEINLDNYSQKSFSSTSKLIFSTYLDLVNIYSKYEHMVKKLDKRNKELESLIYQIPVGILKLDQNLNITELNPKFKQIFELSSVDFLKYVGKSFYDIITEDDSSKKIKFLNNLKNREIVVKNTITKVNGVKKPIYFISVPIFVNNEFKGAYLIYKDITSNMKVANSMIKSLESFAIILSQLAESHNPDINGHVLRISKYSEQLYSLYIEHNYKNGIINKNNTTNEYDGAYNDALRIGSLLHDVGKFKIDVNILNKPSRLTDKEYAEIKKHTEYGIQILKPLFDAIEYSFIKNVDVKKMIYNCVKYHHENYDGTGYYGLKGNNIPLESRIIRIVDVYDALTHIRSYKNAYSQNEALRIMMQEKRYYDPQLFNLFQKNIKNFEI